EQERIICRRPFKLSFMISECVAAMLVSQMPADQRTGSWQSRELRNEPSERCGGEYDSEIRKGWNDRSHRSADRNCGRQYGSCTRQTHHSLRHIRAGTGFRLSADGREEEILGRARRRRGGGDLQERRTGVSRLSRG